MESILREVRQALRGFRRSPGFALTAILILAIGIGANTAVFSIVHAILVRPLPYRDPGRLVWVWSTRTDRDKAFFSIPNFIDTRAGASSFESMAAISNWSANLTGAGDPERVQGIRVTPDLFPMLGVEPEIGHLLPDDGGIAANPRFVLLSHRLWQRRFGGDPAVLGRAVSLSGDLYVVTGVLPPWFLVPGSETDIVVPLDLAADPRRDERGSNFLRVVARLKDSATIAASADELRSITARLVERFPEPNAKLTPPRVVALADEIVGGYRPGLRMLLGAVGLVLLVACANLAGLLLARAAARRREMGLRRALGAQRVDLARSLLVESALLSVLGGAVGLGAAWWSLDLLVAWSPSALPRSGEVSLDPAVLGFTLAIALASALLFGIAPAILGSRSGPLEAMRGAGPGAAPGRARAVLVVSQVALSLVLLVSVGLLTRSLAGLQAIDPGFEPSNLLTVRLSLPAAHYGTPASVRGFYDRLAPEIASIPGVVSVGAVSVLPLSGMNARADFAIVGHDAASARDLPAAQNRWVSPGYLGTMGIEIRSGRALNEHDDADAAPVALIDETLRLRFWPDADPLGGRIRIDDAGGAPSREVAIVGVVATVKHFTLDEEPLGTVYTPFYQVPPGALSFLANNLTLVVRAERAPLSLADAVRRRIVAADPEVAASSVRAMDQILATTFAARRFTTLLLGSFSAVALLLAALGLNALVACTVLERSREMAIRMALGAPPLRLLREVVGQGLRLALLGAALGLLAAVPVARLFSGLLYGVGPADAPTLLIAPAVLTAAAALACFLPARRAARVDPLVTMRCE